jgi:hypothetical protein
LLQLAVGTVVPAALCLDRLPVTVSVEETLVQTLRGARLGSRRPLWRPRVDLFQPLVAALVFSVASQRVRVNPRLARETRAGQMFLCFKIERLLKI